MTHRERGKTRQGEKHRIDPERAAQNMDRQGPSPGDPIDDEVIHSRKSDWVEKNAAAAGDEVTEDELKAFDLLGRSGVRDDAIAGVGDNEGLPTPPSGRTPGAVRKNPPVSELSDEIDMSGAGDGGGGPSGGASGGARGNAGSADRSATAGDDEA